jgi:dihydroorotase
VALPAAKILERGREESLHLMRPIRNTPPGQPTTRISKMNPPLRSARDREAILEGLADGTIEILCGDHAPHCDYEKEVEFDYAPSHHRLGDRIILSLMQLYHTKLMSQRWDYKVYGMLAAVAIAERDVERGVDADVTVFDPDGEWAFEPTTTASKSRNNPFYGWPLRGKAVTTIVGGRIVWHEQNEPARV